MPVELQIQKIFDRAAAIKQAYRNAVHSGGNYLGTKFWDLADAANDEDYENDIKGRDMTVLDLNTLNPNIGLIMSPLISNHSLYFGQTLGLDSRPPFEAYLDTVRWRVSEDFGELYFESQGTRLSPQYVYARGDNPTNVLTSFAYNDSVIVVASLPEHLGDTRLAAVVDTAISGGNFKVDVTAVNLAGEESTFMGVTVPSGSTAGTYVALGRRPVTSIVVNSATVTTLAIGDVTGYKVGSYLILVDETAVAPDGVEAVLITGVDSLTNTVTVESLVKTYDEGDITAGDVIAYPGLHGITDVSFSSTGHTATGGAISIVPLEDRSISL